MVLGRAAWEKDLVLGPDDPYQDAKHQGQVASRGMEGEQKHQGGPFPARMGLSPAVLVGVVPGLAVAEGEQGGSDCGEEVPALVDLVVLVEVVLEPAVGRYQGGWGSGKEVLIPVALVEVSRGLEPAGERSEEGVVLAPVVLVEVVLGLGVVGERRVG
jgi:hypothetical protein